MLGIADHIKIYGSVDRHEWINTSVANPVFLNLSTFISEDFGCAVAEAQQSGWPMIISEHGGHLDVIGENILKVPSSFICNAHYPERLNEIVSSELVDSLESLVSLNRTAERTDTNIHEVSISLLDECRRKLSLQLGSSLSLIHSDYIGAFSDSVQGASFLYKIKKFMNKTSNVVSLIMYDFDDSLLTDKQYSALSKIYSKLDLVNDDIQFISSKNLFYKDTMKVILSSEKIYIVEDRINRLELERYFSETLHISTESITYE